MNHAIAVKSFIVNDKNELLIVRRRSSDVHKPGQWDIPGGRLEPQEDPFLGLKRETMEEANLEIEIKIPIDIQHFSREDGQLITMIIFLCSPKSSDIKLSEEHTEYHWVNTDSFNELPEWIHRAANNFQTYIKNSYIRTDS